MASFWLDGGIELLDQGPATGTVIVPVVCKKGIETGLDIAVDYGPYKASKIELFLTTNPNETFQPNPGGPRCPVLTVRTRVTANQAGLAGVDRIQQISSGPNTTANLFIGTTFQPDGTFNVSKTENVTFSLKRVKGDKAYVLDFGAKQFICKTPAVNTGSNDIKVALRPNTGNTRVPATLVPAQDKAKADAARRHLEAAKKKKVAIAKRKAAAAAAARKKSATPSSVGAATQRRVVRRR